MKLGFYKTCANTKSRTTRPIFMAYLRVSDHAGSKYTIKIFSIFFTHKYVFFSKNYISKTWSPVRKSSWASSSPLVQFLPPHSPTEPFVELRPFHNRDPSRHLLPHPHPRVKEPRRAVLPPPLPLLLERNLNDDVDNSARPFGVIRHFLTSYD